MLSDPISENDLTQIIQAGIREPDHGALSPWKIVIIKGEKLKAIDKKIILEDYNIPKKKIIRLIKWFALLAFNFKFFSIIPFKFSDKIKKLQFSQSE